MANTNYNASDIIVTIDGQVVGEMQPLTLEASINRDEREFHNRESISFRNREYSGTFENVEINEDFIGYLMPYSGTYTIELEGYKFPRGNKLPKKKRIRKKWMNKYAYKYTLENCTIDKMKQKEAKDNE